MASERVTLTVRSNIGEDGPLTVEDAMRQILDFFDLLAAAQDQEPDGRHVAWQIETISKNSPLEISAEPYSTDPAVPVDLIARRAKYRVAEAFNEIAASGKVADWIDSSSREKFRRILKRNTDGIGRTDIKYSDVQSVIAIVERTARASLLALDRSELDAEAAKEDLSRTEIGSIEGDVIQTTTYHKKPALVVRERITGHDVVCVLADDLAAIVGPEHRWDEVWKSRRVAIAGEIYYRADGQISRIAASNFETIEPVELTTAQLNDPKFTSGMNPFEYLEKIREGEHG